MKNLFLLLVLFMSLSAGAQKKNRLLEGMYIQWGYNVEAYTKSNIHFKMSNGDNFILHHAKAHHKPDFDAVYKNPVEVSIPQYNYRLGFYLNKKHSRAIELNFDHAKYVLTDGQKVHVTGIIHGLPVDGDSVLNSNTFLHLEHTDGANWLHLNYVQQRTLFTNHKKERPLVSLIGKMGAGINIPRTDFTWEGKRLNNQFHVAGYNISVEGGARFYPTRKLFFELTGKTGYVKYINAIANYGESKGNTVKHAFGYVEMIGLIGYDIHF